MPAFRSSCNSGSPADRGRAGWAGADRSASWAAMAEASRASRRPPPW